ncbi:transposase [Streptomyces sp. 35M1]|uniref:transposase n=1 Tax=Streptomyces sp. 35M1 TaxID=3142978 RepID=UPI0039907672
MELDTRNCWTLAEALGHCGPHRLQHFLARARIDHDPARDGLAAWITSELADDQAVLVVDETGDEKSSGDAVGARMRTGHGLKSDRHYDWTLLGVPADDTPTGHAAGHSHLVIRRHRYTGELSFYRCHSATAVALATHGRLVPISPRELLRLLRATVLPSPRRNLDHLLHWSAWRREHQHRAAEAHRRWNNATAAATT